MASYIKGGTQAKDILKQDPQMNIRAQKDDNGEWKMFHNG